MFVNTCLDVGMKSAEDLGGTGSFESARGGRSLCITAGSINSDAGSGEFFT